METPRAVDITVSFSLFSNGTTIRDNVAVSSFISVLDLMEIVTDALQTQQGCYLIIDGQEHRATFDNSHQAFYRKPLSDMRAGEHKDILVVISGEMAAVHPGEMSVMKERNFDPPAGLDAVARRLF